MEYLQQLEPWHWLTIGLLLLGLETLGVGGFLIGAAVAAILMAATLWFLPGMSWQLQLSVFAVEALVLSVVYWNFFKEFNQRTDSHKLNDRASQLIGKQMTLEIEMPAGHGRVQIGDTFWKVECSESLRVGDLIEVTSSDGMLLYIEKV